MFEILFYISYSIIYWLLTNKGKKKSLGTIFLVLIISDFGANFIEISSRSLISHNVGFSRIEFTLLIVSIIRSGIIWLVLVAFDYYGMLLLKRSHEERYKKLLLLSSKLNTEMYWMEKNMDNIENVMTKSYQLYEKINHNKDKEIWSDIALNISRDIHEIKKENGLVVRGIKEITEGELVTEGIKFSDIMNILRETMEREAKRLENTIEFKFHTGPDFYTKKHYSLMSILRNLIMNSMDALELEQDYKNVTVIHRLEGENHVFIVSDNGSGMSKKDLQRIYSPGYSTKINYNTGEINRGLGLSIVQYITEDQLKGKVKVKSTLKEGTEFIIYIPIKELEDTNEDIYSG